MLRVFRFCLASGSLSALALGCDYNNDGPAILDATVPGATRGDASEPAGGGEGGTVSATVDGSRPLNPVRGLDAGADAGDGGPLETNESFETALSVTSGVGVLQDIAHSAQSNYFSFEAASAGFYELRTNRGGFSPDVVLSLYDGQRRLLAQNDDGSLWPGDAVDARLVVNLRAPGRYYVKVDDPSTPADYFEHTTPAVRFYRLDIRALDADSDGVAIQQNVPTTPLRFVQSLDTEYSYVTVLGLMEPSVVHRVVVSGVLDQALIGHVLPSGASGDGSTASARQVRVTRVADGKLLAEVDGSSALLELFPPISEGDYTLTVAAPDSLGDNAFYAIDLVMLHDNPREQHEADNGKLASAEPLIFAGTMQRRALLLSDVPGGDVDYYSFQANAGATTQASCEGQSAGSGVRMLTVDLRDDSDRVLATALESPTHVHDLASFTLPNTGTYYLRLSSDHVATPDEPEPWLRCALFVQN